ncbi:MAG: hypothetical protein ACRDV3_02825 [Acidothermaceae bacterium]
MTAIAIDAAGAFPLAGGAALAPALLAAALGYALIANCNWRTSPLLSIQTLTG